MTNQTPQEIVKIKIKEFLENNKPTLLPGGTWCTICNQELCFDSAHSNRQKLNLAIPKAINLAVEETARQIFNEIDNAIDEYDEYLEFIAWKNTLKEKLLGAEK